VLVGFDAVFVAAAEAAELAATPVSLTLGDAVCPAALATQTHELAITANKHGRSFPRTITSWSNTRLSSMSATAGGELESAVLVAN
jgi:hypothetical protein